MPLSRKIIHIDMDAFYASVEQRDAPELVGKPVIVGGDSNQRGVVAACSYEARKFGIHSAMASSTAYKLCPDAIFIRPRFDVYKAVSSEIREIFNEFTKIRYFDFKRITRSITVDEPAVTASVIMKNIKALLSKTEAGAKKVRLLGISISNFQVPKIPVGKKGQLPLPLIFN